MALNFGTQNGTRYYTSNMKPEADEQIDSLWGQNLLDNYAFVWSQPVKVFDFAPGRLSAISGASLKGTLIGTTKFWYREPYTHIRGTFGYLIDEHDGLNTTGSVYIDGTFVAGLSGDTEDTYYKKGFDFDCSHFKTTGNGTNYFYNASMFIKTDAYAFTRNVHLKEAWGFLANEQTDQGL